MLNELSKEGTIANQLPFQLLCNKIINHVEVGGGANDAVRVSVLALRCIASVLRASRGVRVRVRASVRVRVRVRARVRVRVNYNLLGYG